MKRITFITALLFILGAVLINSDIRAQDNTGQTVEDQLKNLQIRIPFIDRDEDGINDLLQNGWGLRFLERYKNRRAAWDQIMGERKNGGRMIDSDGDGTPDTPMRDVIHERMNELVDTNGDGTADTPFGQYMRGLMGELIDTDGDGTPDTPLGRHMRKNFQLFDQNGDGVPDELSAEQLRQHFQDMQQWRDQIRQNILNGRPAFTDEDGDGVPDNCPEGFGWMRRRDRGRK